MLKKKAVGRGSGSGGRKENATLGALKDVATQLGIRVREEKLLREGGYRVRGGGCRVHDQDIVFLDRDRPVTERIDILLDELSHREVDTQALSPSVRRLFTRAPGIEGDPPS